ncbi:helix-hairpin-helix domain-containing protein [Mucilaginibacter conchicola]|uniref:Helix-hairpin-helix domain-containing protein n=1 Tax=Mucilaginibacter conchicola TaxID=2303333 RepID=A0A372NQQ5_9SPHI|nr:helix-hairpin-helix domain-containing protein [Mucilaginibacter conchicola]RFZ90603.1 helix-hairpin-helix domain-containing protein [Mucilaginibacter conchicola]
MKKQLKEHFSITKKEWNGLVVLLLVIALVLAAPYVYQRLHKDTTINEKAFAAAVAQLEKANPQPETTITTGALFKFDPNKASDADWQKLGLTAKQAQIIKNYTAKGGRFRKADDLQKIYGLTKVDYARLAPFIIIDKNKTEPAKVIELNSADSAQLTKIEGIGPAFAKRIIYYRERLGGFVNKEQLKEVFGLDYVKYAEIKEQVRVDARRIRKIDINTITFDQLRLMPYLNYKQVNAIIEYRKEHGNYAGMDDLANIAIIDAQILRKIEPYLVFK